MAEGSLILPHTAKTELEEDDETGALIIPHSESEWTLIFQRKFVCCLEGFSSQRVF